VYTSRIWGDTHVRSHPVSTGTPALKFALTLTNLATGQSTELGTEGPLYNGIQIDGNRIVYAVDDSPALTSCKIMLYDIPTMTEYKIDGGTDGNSPRISGNYVVFASERIGGYALQLVDISDPSSPQLTEVFDGGKLLPPPVRGNFDISGDHVVYTDNKRYIYGWGSLFDYYIPTGSSRRIFDEVTEFSIRMYGNTVVFNGRVSGDDGFHTYMCKL
jgi:hypothetical protein